MAQLIASYTVSDGCTYSNEVIRCIEYESSEAFLVNFESVLANAIKAEDDWEAWRTSNPSPDWETDRVAYTEWLKKSNEGYSKKCLIVRQGNFEFAGKIFTVNHFYYWDEVQKKHIVDLPNVTELPEWFKHRAASKEG